MDLCVKHSFAFTKFYFADTVRHCEDNYRVNFSVTSGWSHHLNFHSASPEQNSIPTKAATSAEEKEKME